MIIEEVLHVGFASQAPASWTEAADMFFVIEEVGVTSKTAREIGRRAGCDHGAIPGHGELDRPLSPAALSTKRKPA
jgi:hypothetical protein